MHVINGVRDPAVSFPLETTADDANERRQANRAVAVSEGDGRQGGDCKS